MAAPSDTVLRVDRGTLRPVRRMDDGRVRCDAFISRAGVFEYLNPDGSIRRELRPPEEVFAPESLASFAQVPVTNNHPPKLIDATSARDYMVGSTGESVTRDDEYVRTTLMVADAQTVGQMEGGKIQTSCGYSCRIDSTPGVHPVYGPYDVRQYKIRGNHVAIVDVARAGDKSAARMDAAVQFSSLPRSDAELSAEARGNLRDSSFAVPDRSGLPIEDAAHLRAAMARFGQYKFSDASEKQAAYGRILRKAKDLGVDSAGFEQAWGSRMDGLWVTTVEDGHAHVIDPEDMSPGGVGYTSPADTADGERHSHAWIVGEGGAVTIIDNAGHSHEVAQAVSPLVAITASPDAPTRADAAGPGRGGPATCHPAISVHNGVSMPPSKNQTNLEQMLATAATQLATMTERATNAEALSTSETQRADQAEGKVASLEAQLASATESRIDAAEVERRDATIHTLQKQLAEAKSRADAAESPARLRAAVTARVKLETAAGAVLGADVKMDGFTDRELIDVTVEKLIGKKTDPERSDDYARACFDTAIAGYFGGQDAMAALRAAAAPRNAPTERADAASARQAMIQRTLNASKPRETK